MVALTFAIPDNNEPKSIIMKLKFTKQLWLSLIFCGISFFSFAQDEINSEFINRMNYVFSPLEKNRVPNGLLLDYAMEFADLKSYNGVLTDSNKTNAGLLRDMYATITMSAIHTNAGGFYSTDYQPIFSIHNNSILGI